MIYLYLIIYITCFHSTLFSSEWRVYLYPDIEKLFREGFHSTLFSSEWRELIIRQWKLDLLQVSIQPYSPASGEVNWYKKGDFHSIKFPFNLILQRVESISLKKSDSKN